MDAVANRSHDGEDKYEPVLTAAGCEKAADFINFCDAFNIPVLTLVNVKGYQASKCTEKRIAKAAGRLTYAYANASVPKVTVIAGNAFGSAYLTMGSKSIGADVVFAWKDAVIGMMDPAEAVKIMYSKEIEAAEDSVALIDEKKSGVYCPSSPALWQQPREAMWTISLRLRKPASVWQRHLRCCSPRERIVRPRSMEQFKVR